LGAGHGGCRLTNGWELKKRGKSGGKITGLIHSRGDQKKKEGGHFGSQSPHKKGHRKGKE